MFHFTCLSVVSFSNSDNYLAPIDESIFIGYAIGHVSASGYVYCEFIGIDGIVG